MAQTTAIPNTPVAVFNGFPVEPATADGAVTLYSGIVKITKASACAMTLAAPVNDGRVLIFEAYTGHAHTLTVAGGIRAAGAGADVGTFGGAVGDGVTLYSTAGTWSVMPGTNLNVTFG